MWPFGRKAEAPAQGIPPVPAPVIRRDWAGLPTIQRLIGAHPLTAPSDRFSDGLATHQDPSVSSDTMGHHVAAEAPSGLVLALARPATRSDGPEMVQRPRVQRRAIVAATDSGEWEAEEAAPEAARPAPPSAEKPAAPVRFELPVAAAPSIQRLMQAPEGEPVPYSGKRRTPALESVLARFEETPMSLADTPAAPVQRLTLGQARRLGLGPPINRVADRAVQRAPIEAEAMPLIPTPPSETPIATTTAPMAMPLAPLRAVEPDTRTDGPAAPGAVPAGSTPGAGPVLPVPATEAATEVSAAVPGITSAGTSITSPPTASATVQRSIELARQDETARSASAASDREDVGRLDLPLVGRTPIREAASASLRSQSETVPASASSPPLSLPLVQRAAEVARESGVAADASPAGSPTSPAIAAPASTTTSQPTIGREAQSLVRSPLATWAAESPGFLAPLVSARPLRPTVGVQRAPEAVPADIEEPISRAFDTSLAGVRIDRSDAGAAAAASMGARGFTEGDDVVLPPTQGPLGKGPARSLLAHELTHVAQQRRLGTGLPAESSPQGRQLELQAQRVERAPWDSPSAPSAEPVTSGSPLPLAPAVPATVQRAMAAVMAQTEAADAQAISRVVTVQREPETASTPAPAAASGTAGETTSAAGATSEPSEQSMDELAGRLYDRIRGRLKNELLVDRERAGFLTDLR